MDRQTVAAITAREIPGSRGSPTIEAEVTTNLARSAVYAGKNAFGKIGRRIL